MPTVLVPLGTLLPFLTLLIVRPAPNQSRAGLRGSPWFSVGPWARWSQAVPVLEAENFRGPDAITGHSLTASFNSFVRSFFINSPPSTSGVPSLSEHEWAHFAEDSSPSPQSTHMASLGSPVGHRSSRSIETVSAPPSKGQNSSTVNSGHTFICGLSLKWLF